MGAYYTFADQTGIIMLLTILGFAFFLWAMMKYVKMESAHLDEAAARLSDKYGG